MTARRFIAGLALLGASLSASAVDFTEGFDSAAALPAAGWLQVNTGTTPTNPWFQGDNTSAFSAQAGPENSYIAANFLSSASGAIDNWLITPELSISTSSVLSFYTRSSGTEGFADLLSVLFSSGSGSDLGSFASLTVIGARTPYPTGWTLFTFDLPDVASGRIAFRQLGTVDTADYLGIDTLRVTNLVAPVPEPETWALLVAGFAAIALHRRRQAGQRRTGRISA